MNENAPIADSDEHPKDQYDDKNENVFLRETESHTQVPAVRITSIILVIASTGCHWNALETQDHWRMEGGGG